MLVPGTLNGSGTNGTAARDASKNERDIFKVSKYHQVFVAEVAREGAVEALTIRRRQRWRKQPRSYKLTKSPSKLSGFPKNTLAVIGVPGLVGRT